MMRFKFSRFHAFSHSAFMNKMHKISVISNTPLSQLSVGIGFIAQNVILKNSKFHCLTWNCPFPRLLLHPLPDISLAAWNLGPLSQHNCLKDMLTMKIYQYLSNRHENGQNKRKICCNVQFAGSMGQL